MNAPILVTGGAGFIGANFVREWLSQPNSPLLINLDKLTYAGNLENLVGLLESPNHNFIQGSIEDSALLNQLLETYKPNAVINFAAESHVDRSIAGPEDFIQTNIVGSFRLLEAVRAYWITLDKQKQGGFRFLHVSTDEVYGSLAADDAAFTERHSYAPNSPYSASKAASDHLVRAYYHTYGLPVLTTNCSNNYGPYQFPEKLIPLVIMNALNHKPLPIYGNGSQIRDWLYVGDHCDAIRTVLEKGKPGEVYNIGGECELTNLELVNTLCEMLDSIRPSSALSSYKALITHVEDRPGHDQRYAIDIDKIRTELGWEPKESFTSGIEKTVRWYLEHQQWLKNIRTGHYRDHGTIDSRKAL